MLNKCMYNTKCREYDRKMGTKKYILDFFFLSEVVGYFVDNGETEY